MSSSGGHFAALVSHGLGARPGLVPRMPVVFEDVQADVVPLAHDAAVQSGPPARQSALDAAPARVPSKNPQVGTEPPPVPGQPLREVVHVEHRPVVQPPPLPYDAPARHVGDRVVVHHEERSARLHVAEAAAPTTVPATPVAGEHAVDVPPARLRESVGPVPTLATSAPPAPPPPQTAPTRTSRAEPRRGALERETAQMPPERTVHVSIDRIEVRATPLAAAPRPPRVERRTQSLEDYLEQRNHGSRR